MFPNPLFAQLASAQYNLDASGFVLVAISVAATLTVAVTGAVAFSALRRKPSIEAEIKSEIATAINELEDKVEKRMTTLSDEVHRLNQERRITIAGLFTKFDELKSETHAALLAQTTTMSKALEDIHRAIGRLEGTDKK